MRPNTKAVLTESPGSQSFEIQDVPAIAEVAHAHGACVLMDNTWATPLFFSPHAHGVDMAIEAGTKYLSGHSDLLLGLVSANEAWFKRLHQTADLMAIPPGPEDVFLALRGLRTMELRLREAERQGLALARWLATRPEVLRRHPPRPARSSGPRDLEARLHRLVGPLQHRPQARLGGRGRGLPGRARALRPRLFLGRLREPRHSLRLHVLPHRDPLGAGRARDPLQRRPRGHRGFEGRSRPGIRASGAILRDARFAAPDEECGAPQALRLEASKPSDAAMRNFLIDTDTASDDAVAIIMALSAPDVRVLALTTVAGNVGVEQATRNALLTADICGADVPVFMGAAAPLTRPLQHAHWFHGDDGLGDHGYPAPSARRSTTRGRRDPAASPTRSRASPWSRSAPSPTSRLRWLEIPYRGENRPLRGDGRRALLRGQRDACGRIQHLGRSGGGARRLPLELADRNGRLACFARSVGAERRRDRRDRGARHEKANFAIESNSRAREAYHVQTGEVGLSLADPTAMAVALDRSVGLSWSRHRVAIECSSELTRGMTVVDRLGVNSDAINGPVWAAAAGESAGADILWTFELGEIQGYAEGGAGAL